MRYILIIFYLNISYLTIVATSQSFRFERKLVNNNIHFCGEGRVYLLREYLLLSIYFTDRYFLIQHTNFLFLQRFTNGVICTSIITAPRLRPRRCGRCEKKKIYIIIEIKRMPHVYLVPTLHTHIRHIEVYNNMFI